MSDATTGDPALPAPAGHAAEAASTAVRGRAVKPKRGAPPLSLVIMWMQTTSERDAVETAKGWAERHLDAPRNAFYAVCRYGEGYLYEIQEGGSGRSYLPGVLKALDGGSNPTWVRVGRRAYTVSTTAGRARGSLQDEASSRAYFAKPGDEALRSGRRMQSVVWRGGSVLVGGLVVFLTGAGFYAATLSLTGALVAPPPQAVRLTPEQLPSRQWPRLAGIPLTRYVEALKYNGGKWQDPVLKQVERHRTTPSPLDVLRSSAPSDDAGADARAAGQASAPMPPAPAPAPAPMPAAPAPVPTTQVARPGAAAVPATPIPAAALPRPPGAARSPVAPARRGGLTPQGVPESGALIAPGGSR